MVFHGTRLVFHRAERRRREARHETYRTPKLVTTRRSILGPPAEGRPGPSDDDDVFVPHRKGPWCGRRGNRACLHSVHHD